MEKKSAKDLAFEKERVKYRKKIHELESCIKQKDIEISHLTSKIIRLESDNNSLKMWVDRLLDYCNMTPEELKNLIESESNKKEMYERFNSFLNMVDNFPYIK